MTKMYGMYAAIAIVVVAGIAWMMMGSGQSAVSLEEQNERNAQVSQSSSGTMADIMARGGSWKCSVTTQMETGAAQGTTYVANGKVRGDFETTVPQMGTMQVHMIADGTTAYTWTSMMKTGFKMAVTAGSADGKTKTADSQDFYNQKYDYECSPWTADMAMFALPTDIQFNDMSAAVQGSAGASATGPNCSTCDMIPNADAKAQCRIALKCK